MTTEQLTALQQELENELARLRDTDIGRRMMLVQALLNGDGEDLMASLEQSIRAAKPEPKPSGRRGPGVSQAKLRAVRQYMENTRIARQVDISKDLDENSGSVSLALRELERIGDVKNTGKVDRKSIVWEFIGEPERATNINVGDGVEQGRRK